MQVFSAMLLFILLATVCVPFADAKPIRLLSILPIRELVFDSTPSHLTEGIQLAKEVWEKKYPGSKVSLDSLRHDPNFDNLVNVARAGIKRKHFAVIGGQMSSESMVLGELFGSEKIVFLTPTSSNPKVTHNRPYVFRMCFSDDQVAYKLANYTASTLKPAGVGIIHNVSNPYSDYLSSKFTAHLRTILSRRPTDKRFPVLVRKVLTDEQDYSNHVKAFKKAKVSHVVILSYDTDLKRFVFQSAQENFFPVYIGSDGFGSNDYIYRTNIKESPFGKHFKAVRNAYWNSSSDHPMARMFRQAFKKKYKKGPSSFHAIGFDTAWLMFHVIKKYNPKNGKELKRVLEQLKPIDLVTQRQFTFDDTHSPKSELHIYWIDKDGVEYKGKS